ncbi:MAG: ferrous iron transporter B, partial [Sulfurovaceae bacterium]|nr:ferrous iron transporter B [Sulfurovaceae bacterium]
MKEIKIALIGQPNVGKTNLTNAISGANLHVGNFPGVTVEKKEVEFTRDEYKFKIVDLPGFYSLHTYSPEEEVSKKYLLEEDYDVILNVIDANQIEKGLSFTCSIADINKPMVCAFNMYDEVKKNGGDIDAQKFSKLTNINAVNTSAKEKTGIEELFKAVIDTYENKKTPNIQYSDLVEIAIEQIVPLIDKIDYNKRFVAIRLLEDDEYIYKKVHEKPFFIQITSKLPKIKETLQIETNEKDIKTIFAEERYALAKGINKQISK